jgi:hypothetical protein
MKRQVMRNEKMHEKILYTDSWEQRSDWCALKHAIGANPTGMACNYHSKQGEPVSVT